jgi:dTDP-glucose 4,6-dehydratase
MNLAQHEGDDRLRLVVADVNDAEVVDQLVAESDAVVHAAAESHVDRSIDDARGFFVTNVLGTQTVIEAARAQARRVLMISTDEVYGQGEPDGGPFDEDHAVRPRSPYAASKAAADLMCQSYVATFGLDASVVRGTNALEGRPVPVYGQGRQRREFLFVRDWVRAAIAVLERGERGVLYNIGDGYELENIDLARRICALAGADDALIAFVPDRPGHDFRYGVSSDRVRALGVSPRTSFDEGLALTVTWYRDHLEWLRLAHEGDVVTPPRSAS